MARNIFTTAEILLPGEGVAPEAWSVIACDQFSSEREYWERVRLGAGDRPSTLNMIIPEAYLDGIDEEKEIEKISGAMAEYAKSGVLREIKDSLIYVERTQSDGQVRKGLVGAVDLEEYEFSGGDAAILASEGTALDRLPPRIRIRRAASLELPHIMTFIADKNDTVFKPLSLKSGNLPVLYDFELAEGGGHLRGMQVSGADAEEVLAALRTLHEGNIADGSQCLMIMGDGNHSLAAAKAYWDEIKQGMDAAGRESHPARRALLEVNNVFDPAITFQAIHRVVFEVDADDFIAGFVKAVQAETVAGPETGPEAEAKAETKAGPETGPKTETGTGRGCAGEPTVSYNLRLISASADQSAALSHGITVSAGCIGDMIAAVQTFIDEYISTAGGKVDYIHDEEAAKRLASGGNCVSIILPAMEKSDFFNTVAARGIFPRKAFSVGHARDKRYYMECRGIKS